MSGFSTTAIILRRVEYGDYDFILTLFSRDRGKISAIAKSAQKSKRRFGGILELFSLLEIEVGSSRSGGLLILKEAVSRNLFSNIRSDIKKTAYACYWTELINLWLEEGNTHPALYEVFGYVLEQLDRAGIDEEPLSILFQMRFLSIAGLKPNFESCANCRRPTADIDASMVFLSLSAGGVICPSCSGSRSANMKLSKGTIKLLQWMDGGDITKAGRIRFSAAEQKESLLFLESFIPYHIGREPKSLKFLKNYRRGPL
ncbi:MAG: DNA repair protein RecO [Desulfobacteraceae bacterium]|nr:DNA repair protein RecO [Desulfobacteraceae bacterium]